MARSKSGKIRPVADRIASPSPEAMRIYGDFIYLAMRSQRHQGISIAGFREAFEMVIALGQFRIFRFDEVPRGLFTWAWLSPEAEKKYVSGEPLGPDDWNSGERLWLIDMIAPYKGLTTAMVRWIMIPGNFAEKEFIFRRVSGKNNTRKIVHIDFERPSGKALILKNEDFL